MLLHLQSQRGRPGDVVKLLIEGRVDRCSDSEVRVFVRDVMVCWFSVAELKEIISDGCVRSGRSSDALDLAYHHENGVVTPPDVVSNAADC
jgi:hypothetical protein